MKTTIFFLLSFALFTPLLVADDRIDEVEMKHLGGFEVPFHFFLKEKGYIPIVYLNSYPVKPRKLNLEEKQKLYILLRSAEAASFDKHQQDYFLSRDCDLFKLLTLNIELPDSEIEKTELKVGVIAKILLSSIAEESALPLLKK